MAIPEPTVDAQLLLAWGERGTLVEVLGEENRLREQREFFEGAIGN